MNNETTQQQQINDGGPVYPCRRLVEMVVTDRAFDEIKADPGHIEDIREVFEEHSGISLRDHFAAQALAGILRGEDGDSGEPPLNCRACWHYAQQAYALADAMLVERAKKGGAA